MPLQETSETILSGLSCAFSDFSRGIDSIGEGVPIKRLKSENVNGKLEGVD